MELNLVLTKEPVSRPEVPSKNPKKVAPGPKVALRLRSGQHLVFPHFIWNLKQRCNILSRLEERNHNPQKLNWRRWENKNRKVFLPSILAYQKLSSDCLNQKPLLFAKYDDGPLTTKPHFWYGHFMSTQLFSKKISTLLLLLGSKAPVQQLYKQLATKSHKDVYGLVNFTKLMVLCSRVQKLHYSSCIYVHLIAVKHWLCIDKGHTQIRSLHQHFSNRKTRSYTMHRWHWTTCSSHIQLLHIFPFPFQRLVYKQRKQSCPHWWAWCHTWMLQYLHTQSQKKTHIPAVQVSNCAEGSPAKAKK